MDNLLPAISASFGLFKEMVLPAGFLIIQRRLFYPQEGVAECSGMGWRNGSEQGGGINRIGMAESPGILNGSSFLQKGVFYWRIPGDQIPKP